MKLRPGLKLSSGVSDAQVVVVRAPDAEVEVACGGVTMVDDAGGSPDGAIDPTLGDGPLLGKRYVDEEAGVELLCSRAGEGALTVDGRAVVVKGAKPLPSSD